MRLILAVFIGALVLSMCIPATADEGRYQAVEIGPKSSAGASVLIIDTKEGHFWTWVVSIVPEGEMITTVIYQGQVRPGKKPGERIYRHRVE